VRETLENDLTSVRRLAYYAKKSLFIFAGNINRGKVKMYLEKRVYTASLVNLLPINYFTSNNTVAYLELIET
jgi:hypothetical protein